MSWIGRVRRVASAPRAERFAPTTIAFAMMLGTLIGGGMLAMPVALASLDVVSALLALGIGGALAALSAMLLVETLVRTVSAGRAIDGTIGSLVEHYIDRRTRSVITTLMTLALAVTVTASAYGFARNMADSTRLPGLAWVGVLGLFVIALLIRPTLNATVGVAVGAGALNVVLLSAIVALSVGSFDVANLAGGVSLVEPGGPSTFFGALYGFVTAMYMCLVGVLNTSTVVLDRDPSGRSLRRGIFAAVAVAGVFYAAMSIVTAGVTAREPLLATTATAIGPLASTVGSSISVVGFVFAPVAIGMLTIQNALGLRNQTRSWLLRTERSQRLVFVPICSCLAAAGAATLTSFDAFITLFAWVGALLDPLLMGILPPLLVIASRQKQFADSPPSIARSPVAATVPILVAGAYLLGMTLHVVTIWSNPMLRTAMVGMIAVASWVVGRAGTVATSSVRVGSDTRQDDRGHGPSSMPTGAVPGSGSLAAAQ